jgi:hypothetical protein
MSLFESKSVQMMLTQLLKAAAPQLGEQCEQIADMIQKFTERQIRMEQMLEKLLTENENVRHGRNIPITEAIDGAENNRGSDRGNIVPLNGFGK